MLVGMRVVVVVANMVMVPWLWCVLVIVVVVAGSIGPEDGTLLGLVASCAVGHMSCSVKKVFLGMN